MMLPHSLAVLPDPSSNPARRRNHLSLPTPASARSSRSPSPNRQPDGVAPPAPSDDSTHTPSIPSPRPIDPEIATSPASPTLDASMSMPRVKDLSRDQLLQLIADMYQDSQALHREQATQQATHVAEIMRLTKLIHYQAQVLEVTKKEVVMLRSRVRKAQAELPLVMMKRAVHAADEDNGKEGDVAVAEDPMLNSGPRRRTVVMMELPAGIGR